MSWFVQASWIACSYMSLQNLSQMPLPQVSIWGQKQPKKAIFSQNGQFFFDLFFSNKKFQNFFFEIPKVDYLGGFRTIFRKCIPLPFKQALFWRYAYDREEPAMRSTRTRHPVGRRWARYH